MSVDSIRVIAEKVDVKPCDKVDPPHPCDEQAACDPLFQENECPKPFLCQERLKNPSLPGEVTRCKLGSYMHVKSCRKVDPPHPCDNLPGCSQKPPHEQAKKLTCNEPPICIERVKNPENPIRKKQDPSCDHKK